MQFLTPKARASSSPQNYTCHQLKCAASWFLIIFLEASALKAFSSSGTYHSSKKYILNWKERAK